MTWGLSVRMRQHPGGQAPVSYQAAFEKAANGVSEQWEPRPHTAARLCVTLPRARVAAATGCRCAKHRRDSEIDPRYDGAPLARLIVSLPISLFFVPADPDRERLGQPPRRPVAWRQTRGCFKSLSGNRLAPYPPCRVRGLFGGPGAEPAARVQSRGPKERR